MDREDVDIRIASLEERLRRLVALPLAEHATLEERLAEVERRVSSLQVSTAMLGVQSTRGSITKSLERLEEKVSEAERGRGYWGAD